VSYEVDVSGVDMSMTPAQSPMTIGLVWPGDIGPRQWYRLALAFDPSDGPRLPGDPPIYTNPDGTLLTVISEQYGLDPGTGEQFTQITIRDDSTLELPKGSGVIFLFTLNVVSTPSLH
jgi:hypothetical protein